MAISNLRERPEFFGTVADRIWRAWWELRGFPLEYIRQRLTENLSDAPLPLALVAHREGQFLGTASLIASDLEELPELTPWVAAVWTEPDARRQGVGRALVARACEAGFALGHAQVYLCALPQGATSMVGKDGPDSIQYRGTWRYAVRPGAP